MTTTNKMSQSQIEGVRHKSSKMRLAQRAEDQSNGRWVPTPFRMGNLGFAPFRPLIVLFIVILIATSFISCEPDTYYQCSDVFTPETVIINGEEAVIYHKELKCDEYYY